MPPRTDSVIAAGHEIRGTIQAGEDLRLEGRLVGRLDSDHHLVIAEGAVAQADLHVRSLEVRGVVVGTVQAVERVTVTATGQVQGDIRARQLALLAGGRVAGQVESGVEVPAVRLGTRRRPEAWSRPTAPAPQVAPEPAPVPAREAAPEPAEAVAEVVEEAASEVVEAAAGEVVEEAAGEVVETGEVVEDDDDGDVDDEDEVAEAIAGRPMRHGRKSRVTTKKKKKRR